MSSEILFSYIIPTIGRKTLDVAVQSVLTQAFTHADFEIIVVNDSGNSLYEADWQSSPRVRILHTNKCERSLARNSGAAMAKGKYLAFLDDDDWILPGALQAFWELAQTDPDASWLYGGIRIIDETGRVWAELNSNLSGNCFAQILGGAWAPIQSSLIRSETFFKIGGFSPFVCGTEDEDLCRRTALAGEFANTTQIVACLFRGQAWSTSTNYSRAPEDTKYSRDLILQQPGVFRRVRTSARSAYVWGRVLRIYTSTISWNLKKRRFFTALSRVLHGGLVMLLSMRYFFSSEYWEGVRTHHARNHLHYVVEEEERRVQQGRPATKD